MRLQRHSITITNNTTTTQHTAEKLSRKWLFPCWDSIQHEWHIYETTDTYDTIHIVGRTPGCDISVELWKLAAAPLFPLWTLLWSSGSLLHLQTPDSSPKTKYSNSSYMYCYICYNLVFDSLFRQFSFINGWELLHQNVIDPNTIMESLLSFHLKWRHGSVFDRSYCRPFNSFTSFL